MMDDGDKSNFGGMLFDLPHDRREICLNVIWDIQ